MQKGWKKLTPGQIKSMRKYRKENNAKETAVFMAVTESTVSYHCSKKRKKQKQLITTELKTGALPTFSVLMKAIIASDMTAANKLHLLDRMV